MAETDLPEGSRQIWYDIFSKFDKSGDGTIHRSHLQEALGLVGIFTSKNGAEELAVLFDKNQDGKLQINELLSSWQILCQHAVSGDDLLAAFKRFDRDQSGLIKRNELEYILRHTGEKWTKDETKQALDKLMVYDNDGDMKFSYPEFVNLCTNDAFPMNRPTHVTRSDITQEYEKVSTAADPALSAPEPDSEATQ